MPAARSWPEARRRKWSCTGKSSYALLAHGSPHQAGLHREPRITFIRPGGCGRACRYSSSERLVRRAWYSSSIEAFLAASPDQILGEMARHTTFDMTQAQRDAWVGQNEALAAALAGQQGTIHLEFSIPRMGRRIDAVVIIGPVVFVVEFKVGAKKFEQQDIDQVMDYALDLHHFHEGSHRSWVAPVLVVTESAQETPTIGQILPAGFLLDVSRTSALVLGQVFPRVLRQVQSDPVVAEAWARSGYKPTPTIIEATLALYRGHSVVEISRSDAGATNLTDTARTVEQIIVTARQNSEKAICFVTGVPGAGKTLVGLNVATAHIDSKTELYSVFLSGNGPLVAILQEALARDKVRRSRERGQRIGKGETLSEVKAFIQNVHHFRDDCLVDSTKPPVEHVAIFDEAQRAWNLHETASFMKRKKGVASFEQSEPEFLISCLDRHRDWAVIVCLVGGGQEINRGEAGIREWARALTQRFPHWKAYASDQLLDSEYGSGEVLEQMRSGSQLEIRRSLHLGVSIRSFRSEKVSKLVKQVLDIDSDGARQTIAEVAKTYPILLARELDTAKRWLRSKAMGSERFGIVVSSQAERLKPYALDVKTPVNPVNWFLNGKEDVRSSYYLEDVATEFHVQGLELDWTCVVWDADLRYDAGTWKQWSFRGSRWERIRDPDRQTYLKNAYRVLLTRARQGMAIVVPKGDSEDRTRLPEFYDPTYEYLRKCDVQLLPG
jgi:hypothetical protein